jgi:hypothetical protein
LTPKQKELIEQYRAEELGLTTSSADTKDAKQDNGSFTINQAWSRLKDFLKQAPEDSSKKSDSASSGDSSAEKKQKDSKQ